MKKILIAYGILVVVVIVLAFARFNGASLLPSFGNKNATVTIKDQEYEVEVAKSDKERQMGLSGREKLDDNKGMLFLFEEKGKYGFWMKNTLIPLDMIFIDETKVVHIVKNARPEKEIQGALPIYTTPVEANRVLELSAGQADKLQLKNGDTVTYSGL